MYDRPSYVGHSRCLTESAIKGLGRMNFKPWPGMRSVEFLKPGYKMNIYTHNFKKMRVLTESCADTHFSCDDRYSLGINVSFYKLEKVDERPIAEIFKDVNYSKKITSFFAYDLFDGQLVIDRLGYINFNDDISYLEVYSGDYSVVLYNHVNQEGKEVWFTRIGGYNIDSIWRFDASSLKMAKWKYPSDF